MKIDVLTLFPGMFEAVLGDSIIGRAAEKGLLHLQYTNIRDFSLDKHKRVDDYPYGAGGGMVMAPQPIYTAYQHLTEGLEEKPHVIYLSPQGKVFTQERAKALASNYSHLILLCGHYEGVDERIIEEIVDEEISIGDYVLTGGEIPAMAVIDAVARMIPGVVQHANAESESLENGLLEYPQYTRPPEFLGRKVPDVLLSGHHAEIVKWRHQKSLERTAKKRPDLLAPKAE
ncbi:MAG: tRNA (guanosine(37)-N1)-methyltransferase TrmD [Clostridia bacterium]|nr:tRNA (guanosine(37)-N1)-methyltransferase TrmD [Clostridia bacterium]